MRIEYRKPTRDQLARRTEDVDAERAEAERLPAGETTPKPPWIDASKISGVRTPPTRAYFLKRWKDDDGD
jgi:hypothetical protein